MEGGEGPLKEALLTKGPMVVSSECCPGTDWGLAGWMLAGSPAAVPFVPELQRRPAGAPAACAR